jgi:uncharacterized protein involved in copper resistance
MRRLVLTVAVAAGLALAGGVVGARAATDSPMGHGSAMGHSKMGHSKMGHSKMGHSTMGHSKMGHSAMGHGSAMGHKTKP